MKPAIPSLDDPVTPSDAAGCSRPVRSTQTGPHEALSQHLQRHATNRYMRPIAGYNREAFELVDEQAGTDGRPLILDSGCGTGDSSRSLAYLYPDHLVIGIDRSADRLSRQREITPENCMLVRADLIDFWRLANQADWRLARHYLLYPNPEPKPRHLKRRFHAHPVFPDLVALGGAFESRSNWLIYLKELAIALQYHGRPATLTPLPDTAPALTLFEQKYRASGQKLWQLRTNE
ncbi:methyltransferase domain-containing protein [Guyparkeria sp. 1SP6A2]|nr:methyltransferase domain-containing protein [Guyparkeria sp. 1SP6A2]